MFLKQAGALGLAVVPGLAGLEKLFASVESIPPAKLASDEEFWARIRQEFKLKRDYINLENGYYCILPEPILHRYIDHIREVNYHGSYYMRKRQFDNKSRITAGLAEMVGCERDELIITRNTTESLDTIISGYPWNAGDEAIMANQDYGAMLNMFKQVEKRHGVVRKVIDVPMNPKNDDEIVKVYEDAITERTKLIMVCHMINITGHILPVRKICDMAHARGVEVMVDGAHAFAHINFKVSDLNCDYYGTSLHKWLGVPIGAGFLYVNKNNIPKIWPLMAEDERPSYDISRLNHTGTHPVHTDLTIPDAIKYLDIIGSERKEARLRFLQNYWINKVKAFPHVVINTPEDPQRSCAIANVGLKNMEPQEMAFRLLDQHNIWTVAIDGAGVHGCRITPNIYTSTEELDQFVKALAELY